MENVATSCGCQEIRGGIYGSRALLDGLQEGAALSLDFKNVFPTMSHEMVAAAPSLMCIFLCLWLSGAQFVVHVSVEVWLALGVFEGEERTGIVRFL